MLGPHLARIYTQDLTTRLAKSLLTAWSGEHSGGQLVIRGFATAKKSLQANKDDSKVSKSRSSEDLKRKMSKSSSSLAQKFQSNSGSSTPGQAEYGREHDSDPSTPVKTGETSASVELLRSISAKLNNQASKLTAEAPSKERQAALTGMLSSGLEDKSKKKDEDDEDPVESSTSKTQGAEMSEENEEDELEREEDEAQRPVDLVLILHGIGQKYAADTQPSLDFTIAVNSFRELVHKQAKLEPPATVGGGGFAQMLDGRRIQFLPVMWRAALEDFEPEPAHEPDDHLDNHFKLDDVFGDRNSIPIVRKLISGVLLDIPLYLSRHRGEIVRRVVGEANRMYRCVARVRFALQDLKMLTYVVGFHTDYSVNATPTLKVAADEHTGSHTRSAQRSHSTSSRPSQHTYRDLKRSTLQAPTSTTISAPSSSPEVPPRSSSGSRKVN